MFFIACCVLNPVNARLFLKTPEYPNQKSITTKKGSCVIDNEDSANMYIYAPFTFGLRSS